MKCSYCPYGPAPLGTFAMRIIGRGIPAGDGSLRSEFRAVCADCVIRLFDAVFHPKIEVPP